MADGPVVLNNTPLVALSGVGRLDILRDLFQEVLIPQEVEKEYLAAEEATRRQTLVKAPWVKSIPLANPRRALAYIGLDLGEAAVLALAEEQDARLVIIDEKKARRFAERLGRPLMGTLGLLLLAKESGLVDSVTTLVNQMQEMGMFLSRDLIRRTLLLAGEET